MPANVEIKARLEDFDVFHTLFKKVYEAKDDDCKTIEHCDTYFNCPNGRLKLREIKCGDAESAELIFYDRSDSSGPKLSNYVKHDCSAQVAALKDCLNYAHGKRGEVKKTRLLYIIDQTRVHIDKVPTVGEFMELEVMLRDDQTAEDGQKIADEFMEKLNITKDMLIKGSYIDFVDPVVNGESKTESKTADAAMEEDGAATKTPVPASADAAAGDAKTES